MKKTDKNVSKKLKTAAGIIGAGIATVAAAASVGKERNDDVLNDELLGNDGDALQDSAEAGLVAAESQVEEQDVQMEQSAESHQASIDADMIVEELEDYPVENLPVAEYELDTDGADFGADETSQQMADIEFSSSDNNILTQNNEEAQTEDNDALTEDSEALLEEDDALMAEESGMEIEEPQIDDAIAETMDDMDVAAIVGSENFLDAETDNTDFSAELTETESIETDEADLLTELEEEIPEIEEDDFGGDSIDENDNSKWGGELSSTLEQRAADFFDNVKEAVSSTYDDIQQDIHNLF